VYRGLARRTGLRQRTPGLLDGHFGVDTVELVEVDVVGAETAQALVDGLADVLGTAVRHGPREGDGRGVVAGRHLDLGGQYRSLAVATGQGAAISSSLVQGP